MTETCSTDGVSLFSGLRGPQSNVMGANCSFLGGKAADT